MKQTMSYIEMKFQAGFIPSKSNAR